MVYLKRSQVLLIWLVLNFVSELLNKNEFEYASTSKSRQESTLIDNRIGRLRKERWRMNETRASNIELLRIIAAFGVMLLHVHLIILPQMDSGTPNAWIMYFGESLSIGAVNVFLLITGFFMYRLNTRSVWKIIEMIAELISVKLFFYFLTALLGKQAVTLGGIARCFIPNNYYVIFYAALFFVSLYYNQTIQKLTLKELRMCVILLLMLFSVWPTLIDLWSDLRGEPVINLSTITRDGGDYGYSIVQFSMMYVLGTYLARRKDKKWQHPLMLLLVYLVVSAVITVWARIAHAGSAFFLGTEYAYSNPLVIIGAVAVFQLFRQIRMKPNKAVNRLAKAGFTVYLAHPWLIRKIPMAWLVQLPPPAMVVVLLAMLCVVYLICWVGYEIWTVATGLFFRLLEKHKLSINVEVIL